MLANLILWILTVLMLAFPLSARAQDGPLGITHQQFIAAWARGDLQADANGDGSVSVVDLTAYILMLEKCPDCPECPDCPDDPNEPEPPTPPEPPSVDLDWWPGPDALDLRVSDAQALADAAGRLNGVGGFLTLETQSVVAPFAELMSTGGALHGMAPTFDEDGVKTSAGRRVVVRVATGVVIDKPMKNVKGQWRDLAFDSVPWTPARHINEIAISIHGDHDRLLLLNCDFDHWKQVMEAQDSGVNPDGTFIEPDYVDFIGGSHTNIYNSGSVPVTASNHPDSGKRSQGVWWQGSNWRFLGVRAVGIGWDMEGDPNRAKCDKFSQWLYGSQNARGVIIEGCYVDGVSNNAIVMKGTDIVVRDCDFDRVVNAVSFGTNQNPKWPCSGTVDGMRIHRLIPLGPKDDPSLSESERVPMDSGVALSFNNFGSVTVRDVRFIGPNTGTRNAFLFINNGHATNVESRSLLVQDCDTGSLALAEIRKFRLPDSGLSVRVRDTVTIDPRVLVRAVKDPSGADTNAARVLRSFVIDGQLATSR